MVKKRQRKSNDTLNFDSMSDAEKLKWFREYFRPHFEKWVTDPVQKVLTLPEGGMPAFVWLACAIDWLAGFWWGKSTRNQNKQSYEGFVVQYFPKNQYDAHDLYDSLRNGLVHMYTIKKRKYILHHNEPDKHLRRAKDGRQIINIENFLDDWVRAKDQYFDSVENDPILLNKLIERYKRDNFLKLVAYKLK